MARLKTLKPLVGSLPPRVGYLAGDEKARDRQRRICQPWRSWYKTARWERLKRQAHVRDMYICQRSGLLCTGKGNDPLAPVANHKTPHRGDPKLFWDIDNIETVAKFVHDGEIQRQERAAEGRGGSKV